MLLIEMIRRLRMGNSKVMEEIYNIRTLQVKVSYEENWAPLGVSAAILVILVLAVATQNPETVMNVAKKFWEFVIECYEGLLRAQPQLTPRLAH